MLSYADRQIEVLHDYVDGLGNGTILANKYVQLSVARYVKDLKRSDLYWDEISVKRVLTFFSLLITNTNNEYAQFELMPFQVFIIANMYGFKWEVNGLRRFRYSYLEMARKSGKTMFSSGLALYHLVADGVIVVVVMFSSLNGPLSKSIAVKVHAS